MRRPGSIPGQGSNIFIMENYKQILETYIKTLKYDNGGAISSFPITCDITDDGDIDATISIPFVGYNTPWRRSALALISEIEKSGPWPVHSVQLFHDKIWVNMIIHSCDPD